MIVGSFIDYYFGKFSSANNTCTDNFPVEAPLYNPMKRKRNRGAAASLMAWLLS